MEGGVQEFLCASKEVSCLLQQALLLPFNSTFVLERALEVYQPCSEYQTQSLLDIYHTSDILLNNRTDALSTEGSHCYGLCTWVLSQIQTKFPSVEAFLVPSWYDEPHSLVGHTAIVLHFSDGVILLEIGCNIPEPVVLTKSCPTYSFPHGKDPRYVFTLHWEEKRITSRQCYGRFRKFVYGFDRKLSASDSFGILTGFLKRNLFMLLAREDGFLLGWEAEGTGGKLVHSTTGEDERREISLEDARRVLKDRGFFSTLSAIEKIMAHSEQAKNFLDFFRTSFSVPSYVVCGPIKKPQRFPHIVNLEDGPTMVCRCGGCESFPLAGPTCVASLEARKDWTGRSLMKVCGCGKARGRLCGRPWCDESHTMLKDIEDLVPNSTNGFNTPVAYATADLGVKHIDPMSLAPELLENFVNSGYCVLQSLLERDLVEPAIKKINYVLSESVIFKRDVPGFTDNTIRATGNKKLYIVKDPDILSLLDPVLPHLSFLFGGSENLIVPREAQLALRFPIPGTPPSEIQPDGWHVDDIFDSYLPPFSILIGVPLNDWPEDWYGNFTLFDGSHHTINKLILEDYQKFVDNYKLLNHPKLERPIQVKCHVRDVFLVHPLVAHLAGPNHSPYIRNAVYFRVSYRHKCQLSPLILRNMWAEFPGISQFLKTNSVGVDGEALKVLKKTVAKGHHLADLSSLNLGKKHEDFLEVMSFMKRDQKIQILRLESNELEDQQALQLADLLRTNKTLTKIDLYDNKIGDVGAAALADVLGTNKSLRMLDFWSNKISDDGICAFFKILPESQLDSLLVNHNLLTPKFWEKVLPFLPDIPLKVMSRVFLEGNLTPQNTIIERANEGYEILRGLKENLAECQHSAGKRDLEAPHGENRGTPSEEPKGSREVSRGQVDERIEEIDRVTLLSDDEVQEFIVKGYHEVQSDAPRALHEQINKKIAKIYEEEFNPGNNLLAKIPELQKIFDGPSVKGALTSVLGENYIMHTHKHSHLALGNRPAQTWHRDSHWGYDLIRNHFPMYLLVLYFPANVPEILGPTEIISGSQYYHEIRGETHRRICDRLWDERYLKEWQTEKKILTARAGTVILLHLDVWHRGGQNFSGIPRPMLKFIFQRMTLPHAPSWNFTGATPCWTKFLGHVLRSEVWQVVWSWMTGDKVPSPVDRQLTEEDKLALEVDLISPGVSVNSALQVQKIYQAGRVGLFGVLMRVLCGEMGESLQRNAIHGFLAGGSEALPYLADLLRTQTNETVLQFVLYGIGLLLPRQPGVDEELFGLILKNTCHESSQRVRFSAVESLGWLSHLISTFPARSTTELTTLLCRVAQSGPEIVRFGTVCALAKLSPILSESNSQLLLRTLGDIIESDESRYSVAYAFEALKQMRAPESIESLIGYLESARWCDRTSRFSGY